MTPSWLRANMAKITVNVWDFGPLWNATLLQRVGFPTTATTLNSFIDIIHSTENKAIKEGTTSVNSNYKSSHVAPNFVVICIMLIRRVCMKSTVVYGRYNLSLFFTFHENNLSTNVFRRGSPPLCSAVIAFPSGPKSHTFTVILAVFAPQPRWPRKPWKGPLIIYAIQQWKKKIRVQ